MLRILVPPHVLVQVFEFRDEADQVLQQIRRQRLHTNFPKQLGCALAAVVHFRG